MNKIKSFVLAILIASPLSVLADSANETFPNEIPKNDIGELLGKTINALLGLAGAIAVWFLIVGGFQYITSAGNPEGVSKAKNTILYAIIGLITVIISFAVVTYIINQF